MYAVKVFNDEKISRKYIISLFGGEQFFDLKKYDRHFATVCTEYHSYKYEAAHYRIKYPVKLTSRSREVYMSYLEEYAADYIRALLDKPNAAVEEIADYLHIIKEADIMELISISANHGLVEITAFLMNYKHEHFPNGDGAVGW